MKTHHWVGVTAAMKNLYGTIPGCKYGWPKNVLHYSGIPETVFEKPPSAELRLNQKDTDSLPPYEVLDPILRAYVEDDLSPRQISDQLGQPLDLVKRIINQVDRNEYKRQQAAPGIKVTSKAFGIGRRFPVAQKYVE